MSANRENRRLVRMLRPAPVYRPSLIRAVTGWIWRHLPELVAAIVVLRCWAVLADHVGQPLSAVLLLGTGVALFAWQQSRRALVAAFWCLVTRHRLHAGLVEVRATTRDGRLPLFLLVKPAPFGERVWLWCRAGISAEDIEDEADHIRAALWARDIRVTRDRRWSSLVFVDVVRSDPLATVHPIRSPLLDRLPEQENGDV